jgi:hypothetical protein
MSLNFGGDPFRVGRTDHTVARPRREPLEMRYGNDHKLDPVAGADHPQVS